MGPQDRSEVGCKVAALEVEMVPIALATAVVVDPATVAVAAALAIVVGVVAQRAAPETGTWGI